MASRDDPLPAGPCFSVASRFGVAFVGKGGWRPLEGSTSDPRTRGTAEAIRSAISRAALGRKMRHPGNRSMTGAMTACALACWASLAAAQVNPGDPSSSALGESPGASGAVSFGGAPAGAQAVIPVGPGPSYPRVPRGITHPPEPFGPRPSNLGVEPLSPLPESRLPLTGRLGIRPGEEPAGPPDGLTIDQAIDRVLRLNPELRAQAREISKARADVLTAGLRSNPLVYADSSLVPYGSFRGTSGGPTHYDMNITHPIDLNQKRRRRVEAAVRAQKVTEAQYQNAVRLQIDNLYTAWVDVLAAQETISLLETGLKSLDDQKQATEALAERGAASRSEVNNVEIQLDSTDLTLLEAQETHDDAKRTLAALLWPAAGRGRDLRDPRVATRLGPSGPAGRDPDPKGPGNPTRSRRVPAGDPPGSIRGPPGPGESPRRRLPAVSAVLESTGPQARRALRNLLGDRADGPPAGLQPQPG